MRYAVDLGNSAAKAALLDGGALRSYRVAAPPAGSDADAWAVSAGALLNLISLAPHAATALRVASVVPAATDALRDAAAARGIPVELVRARDVPLQLAVSAPEKIGVDRVLAAWSAFEHDGRPKGRGVIAVTLGTALTITCVDRRGMLLGGAIAPSPLLAARALADGTAALPEVTLYDESPDMPGAIGASTDAALAAGILRGARGALKALIAESASERAARDAAAPAPAVVLGGGAAAARWTIGIPADRRDPDLVLNALFELPMVART